VERMLVLLKKEVSGFLNSLPGYIAISVFLIVNGLFLWILPVESNILENGYANMDGLFMIGPFVFLFLIPAITMRFFAEEKKTGTIELLMTKPLTDLHMIMAKYLAGLSLVIVSILPTLIYFYSVYQLGLPKGNLDTGGMWGSYIGMFFLGATFVSIGLFASSLTDNQIISFILAIILCGFFYIGFEFIYGLDLFGNADLFIKNLGISAHYASMSKGVIDTRDLLYFLSMITLFILLTKISIESRKW
jgi:ABC-2 type transport system permease protein